MRLVLRAKGPKPGAERGWTCRVARNHTFEALRARKDEEKPLETDDEPDIPVEDQRTLLTHQMEIERRFTAVEKVTDENPERVAVVLAGDARTKEGAEQGRAKDAATRKRRERARKFLASAVSAAVGAVAVVLVVLWFRSPGAPKPALPVGAYATLADAAHQLAGESCAARRWVACLDDLERLDASKMGPREKAAREAAVAGIRQEALAACAKRDFMTCLEGLDTARRYDPAGDADPSVQLARTEAEQRVKGSTAPALTRDPDATRGRGGRGQPLSADTLRAVRDTPR